MEETITFYLDMGNGKIYAANQAQANLFSFLSKLKLKSVPDKTMYVLRTDHMTVSGYYTVTANVNIGNGWQQSSTTFAVAPPKPPKPKLDVVKTKNFLQPSREDRKRWQIQSKVHSRNTSRR